MAENGSPRRSFKAYLAHRRQAFTPQGRFVQAALADEEFPDPETWSELEAYLLRRQFDRLTIIAARSTWESYKKMR
jgi:hypothetical protein